jgi:threonine dehydrogenase-like Zn-dependent dehydrogenase
VEEVDIVVEATGAGPVVVEAIEATSRNGIVCLTGVSPSGRRLELDVGGLNRSLGAEALERRPDDVKVVVDLGA